MVAERTLQNETDLWLLDSTRQTRFTRGADGNIARLPIWSPDGDRIAFESVGSGSVKLAVKSVERRWRRSSVVRIAAGQDSLRLVARRAVSPLLRPRSEDGHRSVGAAGGDAKAVRLPQDRCERALGPVLPGRTLGGLSIERNRPIRNLCAAVSRAWRPDSHLDRRRRLSTMVSRWKGAVLHRSGRQVDGRADADGGDDG